jgi:uncharacterized protein (TIGR03437 family)
VGQIRLKSTILVFFVALSWLEIPLGAQRIINNFAGGTIRSGVPANDVLINSIAGIARDPSGNFVFSDPSSGLIRRVRTDGTIETIAGSGIIGTSGDGGQALAAQITPGALTEDTAGNLYFADSARIRKVGLDGTITTVAGTGIPGTLGWDGPATSAQIGLISSLVFDQAGNLYFSDQADNLICRLTPGGRIEQIAGLLNQLGYCPFCALGDEGPALAAYIYYPTSITIDPAGNLYVVSQTNLSGRGSIRKITPDGIIHPFAGYPTGVADAQRGNGGPALAATLLNLGNITSDSQGQIYAYESMAPGGWLWRIDTSGIITRLIGSTGPYTMTPDGPAAQSQLGGGLAGFVADNQGVVTLRDAFRIRQLTTAGVVESIAGGAPQIAPDGLNAQEAWLVGPSALALDPSGNLYIAESAGCRIRKVGPNGTLTTMAGTGTCSTTAPRGPALSTDLPFVSSMVIDSKGSIYFSNIYGDLSVISVDGTISGFATVPTQTQAIGQRLAIGSQDDIYVGFLSVFSDGSLFRVMPDRTIQTIFDQAQGKSYVLEALGADFSGDFYYQIDLSQNGQTRMIFRESADLSSVTSPGSGFDGTYLAVDPAGNVWTTRYATPVPIDDAGIRISHGGDGGPFIGALIGPSASPIFAPNGDMYFIDTNRVRVVTGALPQTPPVISSGGIVNAASLTGGALAPGELVSIFGTDFGPPGLDVAAVSNDQIATSLNNVIVYFNGIPAVITARTPNQINAFVPYEVASINPNTVSAVVDVDHAKSAPVTVPLAPSAFGLSSADASGSGQGAILNQDGSYNSSNNPAARGSVVSFFGTGEGAINPFTQDGALVITQPFPLPAQTVTVSIGGQDATILYAGEAPFLPVGVLQINAQVPTDVVPGSVPVVVSIGGSPTTRTVTVSVR